MKASRGFVDVGIVVVGFFFLLSLRVAFAGVPSITFNNTETTEDTIVFTVTTPSSSDSVRRNGVLAFPSVSNGATYNDNNVLGGNAGSGLSPGKSFAYEMFDGLGASLVNQTMCTVPYPPAAVDAIALNDSAAIIYFTVNSSNTDNPSGFTVIESTGLPFTNNESTGAETSLLLTGLNSLTDYNFKIRQDLDCDGTAGTDVSSVYTDAPQIRTGPPPGGLYRASASTDSSITVDWNSTNTSSTEYRLYRNGSFIQFWIHGPAGSPLNYTTTYLDNNGGAGLTPGTLYRYELISLDLLSGLTTSLDGIDACTNPKRPTISSTSGYKPLNSTAFSFSWEAPSGGVTSYDVNGTTNITDISATFSGLLPSDLYSITLDVWYTCPSSPCVMTASGCSLASIGGPDTYSNLATAPGQPTATVTEIDSSSGATQLQVEWAKHTDDQVADPTKFIWKVSRSQDGGGTYAEVYNSSYAITYYFDTGLTPATLYYYKIQSIFYDQKSEYSLPDTGCTYPTAPENLQINTINATHLECIWASPTGNGDAISGFVIAYNSLSGVYVTKDITSNITFTTDTTFATNVIQDGPNTCYVRTVVNCTDEGKLLNSSWSSVVGYLAPVVPSVTTQSVSDTQIQITVVPDAANADTVGMTATIFRDGVVIAEDIATPWTFTDSTAVAGNRYTYTAHVEQNGNPSFESAGKYECAKPSIVTSMYSEAVNTTALTMFWSILTGEVDLFFVSSQRDATVQTEGVVSVTSGVTSYSYTFAGLLAGTCYSVKVTPGRDCNTTDLGSTVSATNYTGTPLTISACTTPNTPGLTVTPGGQGVIDITFNITDSSFTYRLWRSATNTSVPDYELDLTGIDNGAFSDSLNIIGGFQYCYEGLVKQGTVESLRSPVTCSCAKPNPPSGVFVSNYTSTALEITWVNPDGNFSFTQITMNDLTDNATGNANKYVVGDTASGVTLTENTPYTIKIRNFLECHASGSSEFFQSSEISLSDWTSAQRPVILLTTTPDIPAIMNVEFYLPDGVSEYSLSLERGGNNFGGTITTPYLDSVINPGTLYSYTGFLIGLNGELSPASQEVFMCTHPDSPGNLEQDNSSTTTVSVKWSSPDQPPDGYYITLDNFQSSLITATDTAGTTARVAALTSAQTTLTARDDSGALSAIVDGSGALEPAKTYKVSVTGCLNCSATDFTALRADDTVAAVRDYIEVCSHFSTIDVHTKPAQPTCTVVTESMTTLQIQATPNAADVNAIRYLITRTDVGLPLANLTDSDLPYEDSAGTMPGNEYKYEVYGYYFNWESVPAVCVGCTKPRPPINVAGNSENDSVIYFSWNDPVLESAVDSYEVSNGDGSWVPANGVDGRDHDFTGLTPSTCYDLNVRTKVDCNNDATYAPNVPQYSTVETIQKCAKPAACVITSVGAVDVSETDYSRKIEVEITTMSGHTYTLFRDNIELATSLPSNNPYYEDSQMFSGSSFCYSCSATINGVTGDVGSAVCGCSRPNEPQSVFFSALSPSRIRITWAAPNDNDNYDWFEVKDSQEQTETNIVTNYFDWPNTLQQATQYTFSVRTVLNCTASGGQALTSDWVDVIAFTSPGTPELSQVDYGTDFIQLAITDSNTFDSIRLFIDGDEYLPGTSLTFPLTISNLVPGTSYRFDAWVYKNGLVNISETLVWCTYPEVPTNLDSVTRFFYGFYVTFSAPTSGALTGYEVWSDIDSLWHGTNLSNGTYAERFYFYNLNITTDFTRTLNLNDRNTLAANGFDLAYGFPSEQFDNLDSGSSYTIKARAFKECMVNEHGSGDVRMIFNSEPITSTAVTGAHPVVQIATTPVSQTEIEINFQTFGQHSNDIMFNIYRYVNGATSHDGNPIWNVTLSDLPKKDTNLQPASLYTYEVSVVHLGIEIYDSDRLALEAEVFYGERNDTNYFPLYNTSNREDAWRGASNDGFDATHINIYSTISGRHSIYNFYFRERTACTYPPNPSSVSWYPTEHNSTGITWTVDDYSHAGSVSHPKYGRVNTTVFLYVNGELRDQLFDDYTTLNHTFGQLPNPKTAYTCEVAIGLTCPDDKINLDVELYGTISLTNGRLVETVDNNATLDSGDILMSFDSDLTRVRKQVTCYTRPSPVAISSIRPGDTDPTTQIRVDYTQPDSGLTYETTLMTELSESPFPSATVMVNETLDFVTLDNLTPGHPFQVEVRSFWQPSGVTPTLTIYSLYAPYTHADNYVSLTSNGQTADYDPAYGCTNPALLQSFTYSGYDNESVIANWTAPTGLSKSYTFHMMPDNTLSYSRTINSSNPLYAAVGEMFSEVFTGFQACQQIYINVSVESGCGQNLSSQYNSEVVFTYTTPATPFWVPASSVTISTSSITLQWDDNNVVSCPTRFIVYREGVASTDPDNNSTAKTMTDDTGLTAGTIYSYEVSASAYGQSSPRSDALIICTVPDPPENPVFTSSDVGSSFIISWSAPSVGTATGYFLSDDQGNTETRIIANSYQYQNVTPGTQYSVTLTLKSYLDCNVTGVDQPRELNSTVSPSFTVNVVTAPARPKLSRHSSTSDTTFVLLVKIPSGQISKLRLSSNIALPNAPVSDEGTFLDIDDLRMNYFFFPTDTNQTAPSAIFTFSGLLDDGTKYEFSVYGVFDGTISADEASLSTAISYTFTKKDKLLGMEVYIAVIVIVVIALVGCGAVVAVVVVVVIVIKKMKAASAVAASGQAAETVAEGGEIGPDGNYWVDTGAGTEVTDTRANILRSTLIAGNVAKAAAAL